MLTCMQEGMPADAQDRKGWPWWKAKKWALHIAGRLFSRYGDPKMHADSGPSKAFAQLWKAHCSSQFLDAHLALLAGLPQVRPHGWPELHAAYRGVCSIQHVI